MSKELEALESLVYVLTEEARDLFCENIKIIKTALKDYELMKQTKFIVVDKKISDEDLEKLKNQRVFVGGLEQCEIKPLFDEKTQKKLKTLEIIKEKPLVALVDYKYTYEEWLELVDEREKDLFRNKEEYDLLKEELK